MKDETVKIQLIVSEEIDTIDIDYTLEEWEQMTEDEQKDAIDEAVNNENDNNRPYWEYSKTITE